MPRLPAIVYADPAVRSVRVLDQVGAGQWYDRGDVVGGARFAEWGLTMTNADIFARN